MSMQNQYGSELLDDIFIYFMRTALRLQKSGGYDAILAPLAARGMLEPDNY